MKISQIKTRPPFNELFEIQPGIVKAIEANMGETGYDPSQPIVIWKEEGIIVDGHTRLMAAMSLALEEIPVCELSFPNEEAALEYAIHNQRNRRNLTDAEIAKCIEALDNRRKRGEGQDRKEGKFQPKAQPCATGKSSEEVARLVGKSPRQVEKVRTVLDHAPKETKEALKRGEKSINRAYRETQEHRKGEKAASGPSTFKPAPVDIGFASRIWEPVTCCKTGCPSCRPGDNQNQAPGAYRPTFHREQLSAPQNTSFPDSPKCEDSNVLICPTVDLFGEGVEQDWLHAILQAVQEAPLWKFLFISEYPERMAQVNWPSNAWVGVAIERQEQVRAAQEAAGQIEATVKFLLCQPLQEQLSFSALKKFDWIVIGGAAKGSTVQPEWAWVEGLLWQAREVDREVFFSPPLIAGPQEFPQIVGLIEALDQQRLEEDLQMEEEPGYENETILPQEGMNDNLITDMEI